MAIDEREMLMVDAFRMTQRLADRLRDPHVKRHPQYDLASAVGLIHNYVYRFNQPALAVEFVLHFHNTVEVWAEWRAWAEVLDTLLEMNDLQPIERARLLNFRSRAARGLHDYTKSTSKAIAALELGMNHSFLPVVADALNYLARIAYDQDDYVASRSYLEQADGIDKTRLSLPDLGHLYIDLGNVAVQQERFEEAHQYFNTALTYYQQYGDDIYAAKVTANIADLLRREGQFDQACSTLQDALRTFQSKGARYSYALAQNDLGCVYILTQQWQEASDAFMHALEVFEELGALATKAWTLTNVVELYVKTHQYDKVEVAAAEAYKLAIHCNKPLVTAGVHVDYGTMLLERGETDEARRLWSEALMIQEARGAKALAKHTRTLLSKVSATTRL